MELPAWLASWSGSSGEGEVPQAAAAEAAAPKRKAVKKRPCQDDDDDDPQTAAEAEAEAKDAPQRKASRKAAAPKAEAEENESALEDQPVLRRPAAAPMAEPKATRDEPKRVMPAQAVRDGKVLREMIKIATEKMRRDPSWPKDVDGKPVPLVHRYVTLCSCSEATHHVLLAIQSALSKKGIPHQFKQVFACEKDNKLHAWEMALVCGDVCLFEDIVMVGKCDNLPCKRHGKSCPVSGEEGVIAGLSCKDFSRMNVTRWSRTAGVLESETSRGGSADTWTGCMNYVTRKGPCWVLLENSDMLLDNEHGDYDKLKATFESLGYWVKTFVVDSVYFAVPMHRRRSYLWALLKTSPRHTVRTSKDFFFATEKRHCFIRFLNK